MDGTAETVIAVASTVPTVFCLRALSFLLLMLFRVQLFLTASRIFLPAVGLVGEAVGFDIRRLLCKTPRDLERSRLSVPLNHGRRLRRRPTKGRTSRSESLQTANPMSGGDLCPSCLTRGLRKSVMTRRVVVPALRSVPSSGLLRP